MFGIYEPWKIVLDTIRLNTPCASAARVDKGRHVQYEPELVMNGERIGMAYVYVYT